MDAKRGKIAYPRCSHRDRWRAEKRSKRSSRDATAVDFGDPTVHFMTMPGTGESEAVVVVQTNNGMTVILNDLIFDLANRPGLSGWLFKALGMTGDEPHIVPPVKLREVKDKQAVSEQLERWAQVPNLQRVIISHGDIIASSPAPSSTAFRPSYASSRSTNRTVAGQVPRTPTVRILISTR